MKKLITICIFMATAFSVNAQDGKPTKEQTIEYIKSFFEKHYTQIEIPPNTGYYGYYTLSKDYIFDINNTAVTIKYKSWDGSAPAGGVMRYKNESLQFDLKEIERITISKNTSKKCSYSIGFIAFNKKKTITSGNEKLDYVSIPLYAPETMECDYDASEEEILKALKYLRKLCGGPEPVKPLNFN
nr:hypothetical protein [uncultured Flavobacterium sp.]